MIDKNKPKRRNGMNVKHLLLTLLIAWPWGVLANEKQELLEIKNTILNLVDALVEQGVLTQEKADTLKRRAAEKAGEDAASAASGKEAAGAQLMHSPAPVAPKQVVRVPYVPEIVKEEIRAQVRAELREDVVSDVLSQAKNERWGVPDALPEWVSRIKFKFDARMRNQSDFFAEENLPNSYPDFNAINDAGGIDPAGEDAFFNTTEDRNRWRARIRAGADLTINTNLKAGVRLSTGNQRDPVSTNQTLGNTGNRWETVFDRAYLRYGGFTVDDYPWLTVWAGRIPNPWFSTDLVWDKDLGFEGVAATLRKNLLGGDSLFELTDRSQTLFITLGAFPIQEVELSNRDKWLLGAQAGTEWIFENQSRMKFGLAYYDYRNITGQRNAFGSTLLDFTAPEFVQKGNTVFDIRNDADPDTGLFALASDYKLLNLTASYDFAQLAPIHVILTGDYVRNIGFDEDEIFERTGSRVEGETEGYQL